jgi:hypothetical protein
LHWPRVGSSLLLMVWAAHALLLETKYLSHR